MNSTDFNTCDTPLAAYLLSQGFTLIEIKYNNCQRGTYVFDVSDPSIGDHIQMFNRCEAYGNINIYESSRRKLLDKVKNGLS